MTSHESNRFVLFMDYYFEKNIHPQEHWNDKKNVFHFYVQNKSKTVYQNYSY